MTKDTAVELHVVRVTADVRDQHQLAARRHAVTLAGGTGLRQVWLYCTARLRKRSNADTGRRVPAASSTDRRSSVVRPSRSASRNATSATIAVAKRSCLARRAWRSSARHL